MTSLILVKCAARDPKNPFPPCKFALLAKEYCNDKGERLLSAGCMSHLNFITCEIDDKHRLCNADRLCDNYKRK